MSVVFTGEFLGLFVVLYLCMSESKKTECNFKQGLRISKLEVIQDHPQLVSGRASLKMHFHFLLVCL